MKQDECIVYLEVYEKVGDGIVDAIVDFRQRKDYEQFLEFTGQKSSDATYIELRSLKSAKRLRRGCYYKLNLELIKDFQTDGDTDSLLIGASYDLQDMEMPKDDDAELLQKHEVLDPEEMSMAVEPQGRVFDVEDADDLKLFVKDVGQANWNELRRGNDVLVLYDAGARLRVSQNEVRQIIDSRKDRLMDSKPVLVISHWDADHTHCLKGMSEQDVGDYFSKIVCPDKIKNATSQAILEKFERALGRENVYCLPLPERTDGITMHLWRREGLISLFQGEKSREPNYCGLVMFVKGSVRSANYTGDCRLSQAANAYRQEMNEGLNTNEHILIAPHHGGDCGADHRHYLMPCNLIAISVGQNSYGHPNGNMLAYLQSLGDVKQTNINGDLMKNV